MRDVPGELNLFSKVLVISQTEVSFEYFQYELSEQKVERVRSSTRHVRLIIRTPLSCSF